MAKQYFAYLLRLWQLDNPDHPTWRASLEDPHTRQVIGFASLEALWAYLLQLAARVPEATPIPSASDEPKRE